MRYERQSGGDRHEWADYGRSVTGVEFNLGGALVGGLKWLGPIGLVYGTYSAVEAIAEAPPEERARVASQEVGALVADPLLLC